MNVLFPVCVQVDGVALVQGVQEGREMNAPPLPLEERQQSERISSTAASENTEEFGSLLFVFFLFVSLLLEDAERKRLIRPPERKTPDPPELLLNILPRYLLPQSFQNLRTTAFLFKTTQTADARGVFGAELKKSKKKKRKCC